MREFEREISHELNVPSSTVIVKWKRQGSNEPNHSSGRSKKLTDRNLQTLKRTVENNRPSGLLIIAAQIQRSVIGIGFQGCAASQKPLITRTNTHRRLEWYKQRYHWTMEQWQKV